MVLPFTCMPIWPAQCPSRGPAQSAGHAQSSVLSSVKMYKLHNVVCVIYVHDNVTFGPGAVVGVSLACRWPTLLIYQAIDLFHVHFT